MIVGGLFCWMYLAEPEAHITPDYEQVDLQPILQKEHFSQEDYQLLWEQTGLSKTAIDQILDTRFHPSKTILDYQQKFFDTPIYQCYSNTVISHEEIIVNQDGKYTIGTSIANVQEGDVFITKSSHTFGWRNGHAAIVVDEENKNTLESITLGTNSRLSTVSRWESYPNFIQLRLKDTDKETRAMIAQNALVYLNDLPYSLGMGLWHWKNQPQDSISCTNCSHLVWQAYQWYGYDLDSDGGFLVTPKDLANSDLFEVIQVYGVDPNNIWP